MRASDIFKAVSISLLIIGVILLALVLWSLSTTKRVDTIYVDKCLFEVDGFEDSKYPVYELHPWEDCEE